MELRNSRTAHDARCSQGPTATRWAFKIEHWRRTNPFCAAQRPNAQRLPRRGGVLKLSCGAEQTHLTLQRAQLAKKEKGDERTRTAAPRHSSSWGYIGDATAGAVLGRVVRMT